MFGKKIKVKNNQNSRDVRRSIARPFILFFLAVSLAVSSVPFFTNNASASGAMEPHISRVLYKNALATCIAYSPLRDDMSMFSQKNNINESNAANLRWFNDSPSGATNQPLDVFAGVALKLYGSSTVVDDYGRVQCSNPVFIKEALQALGYTVKVGDANNVYPIMCELGFRRDKATDTCAGGAGSWDRRDLGAGDSARDKVLAVSKFSSVAALTDAEKYWLGYTSFKKLCDATITAPGSANISQGVTTIKEYNGNVEDPKMVDMVARWGSNVKSIGGTFGSDMYTVGTMTKVTTNYPPGVSAGQVIAGSVRIGALSNGCVGLATSVNGFADEYLTWAVSNPTESIVPPGSQPLTPEPTVVTGTSSCGIEGIGWIVCPVLSFTGSLADSAFDFLSSTFLETKASIVQDPTVKSAWSAILTLANIAFVIAFLIIIFSQLTGTGVSNYGVKKMLPRLIIAAILVNVSYYVCLIAVDISNILGYSLNDAISSTYAQIKTDGVSGDASGNALGIAAIVAGVIAGTVTLALTVTVPVLLAALLALAMIVLILVARTALIILLVIIAPLAFVAFLFPNTEQWFKKWYKMFIALLLVFPIIAVVFGASTLAAKVINDAANGDAMMQIVAVGVAALPLFVVPSLLKGSINAAGTIGTKLSGISSKLNGKIGAQVKDTSKLGQMRQYRGEQGKIRRAQILGGTYKGSNANPLNWGRNASSWANNKANQNLGGFGNSQSRLGDRINAKIEAEEVTAAKATIDKLGLSMDQTTQLARGESIDHKGKKIKADTATQKYAISSIIQTGDHDKTRELIDSVGNGSDTSLRVHLADALASSSARPGYVGGAALGAIRSGTGVNAERLARDAVAAGTYSPDKIARGDKDELTFISRVAHTQSALNPGDANYDANFVISHQSLIDNAFTAQTDPELARLIGKNRGAIDAIRTNTPPPLPGGATPPTTPPTTPPAAPTP